MKNEFEEWWLEQMPRTHDSVFTVVLRDALKQLCYDAWEASREYRSVYQTPSTDNVAAFFETTLMLAGVNIAERAKGPTQLYWNGKLHECGHSTGTTVLMKTRAFDLRDLQGTPEQLAKTVMEDDHNWFALYQVNEPEHKNGPWKLRFGTWKE